MNIMCPRHPKEILRISRYSKLMGRKGNRYATTIRSGWMYCEKCDKMYKPRLSFKVSLR